MACILVCEGFWSKELEIFRRGSGFTVILVCVTEVLQKKRITGPFLFR